MTEWNKLGSNLRSFPSYLLFKKIILAFLRFRPGSAFNVPNSLRLN